MVKMNLSIDSAGKFSLNSRMAYWLLAAAMIFLIGFANAQKAIPELWGLHVHDEAHILKQPVIDQLEQQLITYQDSTSNEIAILIIPSLEGDALEDYSMRVVEKWKLGNEEKDNGVLLLIVADEHKIRIETGYGLEGVLTDAKASRIIRNEIAPHFRQNQYDEGVIAGVNAIVKAIGGEYEDDDDGLEQLGTKERLLIGLFIFGILGVFTFMGLAIPGCGGWFLYAFLIPFYAAFPMIALGKSAGLLALGCYVVGFPIIKLLVGRTDWGKRMAKKMTTANQRGASGWSRGSGWSSGGGGRSSGGFSGGGGSFGGGGSSGSW
jgi:uncharacterized protein